jgi:hypothetical protein
MVKRTSRRRTSRNARRVSRNAFGMFRSKRSAPREVLEHEESRFKTREQAEKQATMLRTAYRDTFTAKVREVPSRSRAGEASFAVIISPTKKYEPIWRELKGLPPRKNGRRISRNPPPLYRAIGVDSAGHRHAFGAGPVGAMRETAMARWLGDPSMRSAYVIDGRGHSHLSLEPRDRVRLQSNRGGERLDMLEHELERELTQAWSSLRAGDSWRAQDAFAHIEALADFATPSQRSEIRSLGAALRQAHITPWHSEPIRRNGRHLSTNKLSEMDVWNSIALVRQEGHPTTMADMLPPGVAAKFKRLPPGLYKYGYGPKKGEAIVQFKNASLKGAMTSTRIGASKVGEYHWIVDNFDPKFPVIVRGIDDQGRSYFRVEEYAKTLVGVPVAVQVKSSKR